MKKSRSSLIWGLVIIAVGILFLGNSLNIWNINVFFKGWWTLFIIVPSLIGLFKRQTCFSSFLGLAIGILLLLAAQDIIAWKMVGEIFIPILIIMIGVSFVFRPTLKKTNKTKGTPEYIGVFSGCDEKVTDDFKGATCVAVFGGIDLDLTKAKITEDITIDGVSVFGSIDVKLPDNVKVKTSGTPIFGSMENIRDATDDKNAPTVYINYVCIFAGIDVK